MNELKQIPKETKDPNRRAIIIMIVFVVMIVFLIGFELYTKK